MRFCTRNILKQSHVLGATGLGRDPPPLHPSLKGVAELNNVDVQGRHSGIEGGGGGGGGWCLGT